MYMCVYMYIYIYIYIYIYMYTYITATQARQLTPQRATVAHLDSGLGLFTFTRGRYTWGGAHI